MQLYVYKNNQQLGQFYENIVLDQLISGQLSPDDCNITNRPLRVLLRQFRLPVRRLPLPWQLLRDLAADVERLPDGRY
jgi:hypothetical protein